MSLPTTDENPTAASAFRREIDRIIQARGYDTRLSVSTGFRYGVLSEPYARRRQTATSPVCTLPVHVAAVVNAKRLRVIYPQAPPLPLPLDTSALQQWAAWL